MKTKKVLLYPRVSSDEQADKGFSIRAQDEKLVEHCKVHGKEIMGIFNEDYSAWKGFNRPQWNKILDYIKAHKGQVHEVIFTKWDRFSRNASEAYAMIKVLYNLGVVPVAIEQPIDMSVPENKLMLAFYLSAPEVENDRRSLNTLDGMRRAKTEGRHLGHAPFGYVNGRDQFDKPIIITDPARVLIVKEIFESYNAGMPQNIVWKQAKQKGLNLNGNDAFKRLITNCVYAGFVYVKAHGDVEEKMVKGIHDAIISEDTYWRAQARLKRDSIPQAKLTREELPLRGVLFCTGCGKLHSGGRVKGKNNHYWYYQCHRCGNQNHLASRVHDQLKGMLESMSFSKHDVTYMIEQTERELEKQMSSDKNVLECLTGEYNSFKMKIKSLNEKYVADRIDYATYADMKANYTHELNQRHQRIQQISQNENEVWKQFHSGINKLTDIYYLYDVRKDVADKQELVHALFPGCLNRVSNGFQTPYLINELSHNTDNIKHLTVGYGGKIVPISAQSPSSTLNGNEFKHLLKIIAA